MRWDIEAATKEVDKDHDFVGVGSRDVLAQSTSVPRVCFQCQEPFLDKIFNVHTVAIDTSHGELGVEPLSPWLTKLYDL
jgi:hypothetical protein